MLCHDKPIDLNWVFGGRFWNLKNVTIRKWKTWFKLKVLLRRIFRDTGELVEAYSKDTLSYGLDGDSSVETPF
jgi:hypothetical protein